MRICFEDGRTSLINFRPVLSGPLFSPLLDLGFFKEARLDPQAGTLVWPNGADFDPDTLYNWPSCDCTGSTTVSPAKVSR